MLCGQLKVNMRTLTSSAVIKMHFLFLALNIDSFTTGIPLPGEPAFSSVQSISRV